MVFGGTMSSWGFLFSKNASKTQVYKVVHNKQNEKYLQWPGIFGFNSYWLVILKLVIFGLSPKWFRMAEFGEKINNLFGPYDKACPSPSGSAWVPSNPLGFAWVRQDRSIDIDWVDNSWNLVTLVYLVLLF